MRRRGITSSPLNTIVSTLRSGGFDTLPGESESGSSESQSHP
ncbi:hypothetical protein HSB1_15440 [Halogranum salarium B-1]|uniref:Uncharacterized protein n=1 Tax=Halogranum salarium B-1 TaxID=1210908 RepID=J3JHF6_9EURY|nr:hypothetical protein HSB1_15440 [Halogranum salarium B-1]